MKKYTSWVIIGCVVVAIVAGMVWYGNRPGQYDQFATCIKNSGATFFGTFWCSSCQKQKVLFGKSAVNLPYVECSTPDGQGQNEACKIQKIAGYPTWEFKDGSRKSGQLSLQSLSTFTGCPIAKGQ